MVSFALVQVQNGLDTPVFVTHASDERLFYLEQGGRIRIIKNGAVLGPAFLDVSPLVTCCGEQGLLGLAFEPNYASTGRFYIYYTNTSGDQVIARYTVSAGDPDKADPNSRVGILTIPHPTNGNHNGGWLGFGPDGMLYAGVGDGGGGGDPFCAAQNPDDLRGKILRLNVVGQSTYVAPPDNIFALPQKPEVWAMGLRNPWRSSFDRQTGDLYIGDVGQGAREEVSHLAAGSPSGADFGWSTYEGSLTYSNSCPDKTTGVIMPATDYGRSLGTVVTGGYVYRGNQHAHLNGTYFFGDFDSGRIWALWVPTPTSAFTRTEVINTDLHISSFGEDSDGELYVVDYGCYDNNSCNPTRPGAIYRLTSQSNLLPRMFLPMTRRQ
jgi:glucose/arabinose dehydrogenase